MIRKLATLAAIVALGTTTAFAQTPAAAPAKAASANPQVEFDTTAGKIRIELYPDVAPKTVANFLHYVKEGYYTGLMFHRVIDGFMIQGGGYGTDYKSKPLLRLRFRHWLRLACSTSTQPHGRCWLLRTIRRGRSSKNSTLR